MSTLPKSTLQNFSEGLFQRLLVIYPKAHRAEYGPSMNQLFRDQCRDAWREARDWGLIKLWFRVLPDLLRTSMVEHLATFKQKSMNKRMNPLLQSGGAPLSTFITVSVAVFVLVLITSVLITFILPESFASTARIRLAEDVSKPPDPYHLQTAFEVIQSDVVLSKVVDELNLKAEWGKKYSNGQSLKTSEAVAMLRSRVDLRPIRNTQIVEIKAYDDNPNDAARIANAIGDAYLSHSRELKRQRPAQGEARSPPRLARRRWFGLCSVAVPRFFPPQCRAR